MKACRCEKSYPSLEELVKDDTIEAVFCATDAPSHARHSIEVLKHGKHACSAVPACFGSVEDGERLLEAVETTGLKYQMMETSCFREDCYAMRTAYRAGALGTIHLSEGNYHHYHASPEPTPSYNGWRRGVPPLWYPTHSTAYTGLAKDLPDLTRPALPPEVPGGGHGGSHGYLMDEFITAILEDRDPLVNVYEALSMTVPGIVAHQSALKGGERLPCPQYRRKT